MAMYLQLFVLITVAFALTQIGEGLKCYNCVAPVGGECDNPTNNKTFISECPTNANMSCLFQNKTRLGTQEIIRSCAFRTECPTINSTCKVCDTDLCNESSNLVPTVFIVGTVAVMFINLFL